VDADITASDESLHLTNEELHAQGRSHTDEAYEAPPAPRFSDLDVHPKIVAALEKVGITHAFPIQALTLPVALTGHDIIGQAKTGTGKTLGFGIPLLQSVIGPGEAGFEDLDRPGAPQSLVVVPTRELAVQVAGDLDTAASLRSVRVLTVYGGRAYEPQVEALKKGVEVVVGTPGRLLDLAQQKYLNLAHARIVVLDEADEMLDLGFLPDVERLLSQTPAGRQTMLFSATMPSAVVALARRYMTQPTHVRAAEPDDAGATVKAIRQVAYRAHNLDKVEMISRILQARGRGLTMIFARTKRSVAKVCDDLTERGFAVGAIHGDLGQGAREQALRAFRNGKVDVLVATDVAARGIDVDDVTHVINYQCPEDEKTYLHRIGRTGRAGNKGTAVTFVDWDELMRWTLIDKALEIGIPAPPETYSSSPSLFTDLDIPEGTRGTLPRSARTRAGLSAEQVEDLGETGRHGGAGAGRGSRDGGRDGGGRGSRDGGRGGSRDGGRGGRDGGRDGGSRDGGSRDAGPRDTAPRDTAPRDTAPRDAAPDGGAGGEGSSRTTGIRQRRRTRGGASAGEAQGASANGATAAMTTGPEGGSGDAGDASATPARRRRRRRSGGGSRAEAGATESVSAESVSAE
jgi:superfamily II DNA/RNA helicase